MSDQEVYMDQWIGRRLKRDILNEFGCLLISASTVLQQRHIALLKIHGIELTEDDVTEAEQHDPDAECAPLVDQMTAQLRDMFLEIRYSKKIPLADIRKDIVPLIRQCAETPNLFGLLASLQAKDDYLYRHFIGVAVIATLIGKWLHMEEAQLLQLSTAALLHDVGKMKIPSDILDKPGKLTKIEFEIMKRHTVFGYELVKETVGLNHRQALVALQHHERMNGSGYPFGLKQDKIDVFSRIVMVADVFHAMTSETVYRGPQPLYGTLKEISRNAFGVFDAKIVSVFLDKMMRSLVGQQVRLTDGRTGKIVMINSFDPMRPLIHVEETFLDLGKNAETDIESVLP